MRIVKAIIIIIITMFFLLAFHAFTQDNPDNQNVDQLNRKIDLLEENVNGLKTLVLFSITLCVVLLVIIDIYIHRKSEKEIKDIKNSFNSWLMDTKSEIAKRDEEMTGNEDKIRELKASLITFHNYLKDTIEELQTILIKNNTIPEEDMTALSLIMSNTDEIKKKRFNMYKELLEESMVKPNKKKNIYTAIWGIATNCISDIKDEAKNLLKKTQKKYEGTDQTIVHEILQAIMYINKLDRIKPPAGDVVIKI